MRIPDDLRRRKHWFDRPDMLFTAACSLLVSACLLLIVPSVGTLFLEVLAGAVILGRASVLRVRQREAAQLCLDFPATGNHTRRPDRYDLVLIIVVILSYGATAAVLRGSRISEIGTRIVPLMVFASGLLAKNRIVNAVARQLKTGDDRPPDAVSMGSNL